MIPWLMVYPLIVVKEWDYLSGSILSLRNGEVWYDLSMTSLQGFVPSVFFLVQDALQIQRLARNIYKILIILRKLSQTLPWACRIHLYRSDSLGCPLECRNFIPKMQIIVTQSWIILNYHINSLPKITSKFVFIQISLL